MARILIVDDEAANRMLVGAALEPLGHFTYTANNGQEALDLIAQDPPDLVVLDVMMPGVDGWQVLRELRRTGLKAKTKVLLLTSKGSEADYLVGWKLGVDEYLTKPFDPDALVEAVDETLSMSKDELQQRRAEELDKAGLLSRIQTAFGEG